MSAAVELLKHELVEQREMLAVIESEHKATIEAGRRAQNEVDAQRRRVRELSDGIRTIEAAELSERREVPA